MATITMTNVGISACDTPYLNGVVTSPDTPLTILGFTMQDTNPIGIEYQYATDVSFTNIILTGIVNTIAKTPQGTFTIDTPFNVTPYDSYAIYVRIRKKCNSTDTSGWSNWIKATQGTGSWGAGVGVAAYAMNPVVVVPANYSNPTNQGNIYSYTICYTGNAGTANVNMDTAVPQIGTQLYLSDGVTKLKPGSIPSNFCGVAGDCNTSGIRWIKFSSTDPAISSKIWDVEPATGKLLGISTYTC